jgi:hypothetical protein
MDWGINTHLLLPHPLHLPPTSPHLPPHLSPPLPLLPAQVVVIDRQTLEVVAEYKDPAQRFIRPTERPTLTQFCTDLTGIRQDQVKR